MAAVPCDLYRAPFNMFSISLKTGQNSNDEKYRENKRLTKLTYGKTIDFNNNPSIFIVTFDYGKYRHTR